MNPGLIEKRLHLVESLVLASAVGTAPGVTAMGHIRAAAAACVGVGVFRSGDASFGRRSRSGRGGLTSDKIHELGARALIPVIGDGAIREDDNVIHDDGIADLYAAVFQTTVQVEGIAAVAEADRIAHVAERMPLELVVLAQPLHNGVAVQEVQVLLSYVPVVLAEGDGDVVLSPPALQVSLDDGLEVLALRQDDVDFDGDLDAVQGPVLNSALQQLGVFSLGLAVTGDIHAVNQVVLVVENLQRGPEVLLGQGGVDVYLDVAVLGLRQELVKGRHVLGGLAASEDDLPDGETTLQDAADNGGQLGHTNLGLALVLRLGGTELAVVFAVPRYKDRQCQISSSRCKFQNIFLPQKINTLHYILSKHFIFV